MREIVRNGRILSLVAKVGRNDPCPCGSGKKFKKCCESKGQVPVLGRAEVAASSDKMTSLFKRQVPPAQLPQATPEIPPDEKHLNI
jgi:hypothetical protein